jgi:hypothetical protein
MNFFISQNAVFGWYQIPLYPVLCVGVARYVATMWNDVKGWSLWLWMLATLPYMLNVVVGQHFGAAILSRYFFLAVMLLMPLALLMFRGMRRSWAHALVVLLVVAQLGTDVYYVLTR